MVGTIIATAGRLTDHARESDDMEWESYPPEGEAGHTVVGAVRVLRGVRSAEPDAARDVYVYLPPSYGEGERRYPVIYMQDGQNLFDSATSFAEEWRVDEAMESLAASGVEAIVVGVANTGEDRCDEYSPFVDPEKGGGCGDDYLDFLLRTVKARVDADFRTRPGRESTGIVGSSMGALISLYAFFRHPESFGFAGAMSPAFWFARRAIFPYVEAASTPEGRIYLDVGTAEGEDTLRNARAMRDLLVVKGYPADAALRYVEAEGAGHSEGAWAERIAEAVSFLLAA